MKEMERKQPRSRVHRPRRTLLQDLDGEDHNDFQLAFARESRGNKKHQWKLPDWNEPKETTLLGSPASCVSTSSARTCSTSTTTTITSSSAGCEDSDVVSISSAYDEDHVNCSLPIINEGGGERVVLDNLARLLDDCFEETNKDTDKDHIGSKGITTTDMLLPPVDLKVRSQDEWKQDVEDLQEIDLDSEESREIPVVEESDETNQLRRKPSAVLSLLKNRFMIPNGKSHEDSGNDPAPQSSNVSWLLSSTKDCMPDDAREVSGETSTTDKKIKRGWRAPHTMKSDGNAAIKMSSFQGIRNGTVCNNRYKREGDGKLDSLSRSKSNVFAREEWKGLTHEAGILNDLPCTHREQRPPLRRLLSR